MSPGRATEIRRPRRRLRHALAFAGLAAALLSARIEAEEPDPSKLAADLEHCIKSVFEKCRGAVVRIEASDSRGRLAGSGFFIDPNGTLYTSYSIGGDTHDIVVSFGEKHLPARCLVSDVRGGIAILKVDAETPFLCFGDSRELAASSPVMTVGFPFDLPASPSFGLLAGRDIKYRGLYFGTRHLRTSVPVQRGQGGAPLLDLRGQVVGILISSLDAGSGSFALPIEAAEKVRRDLLRFHEVRRGWLGVEVEPAQEAHAGSTATVTAVTPDSPALHAGVQSGDTILRIGDRGIASPDDVLDASYFLTSDDPITIHIARGDQELDLEVQPTDHPETPSALKRIAPAFLPGPELATPQSEEAK